MKQKLKNYQEKNSITNKNFLHKKQKITTLFKPKKYLFPSVN
jgi:hypothetical protein